jgi:hypothetical protein
VEAVSTRARLLTFGAAATLVLAGALCAVFVGGVTGEVLTIALMSAGFGGAVLLVFLEVGLSEDRERAELEQRARRGGLRKALRARAWRRWPRRPD